MFPRVRTFLLALLVAGSAHAAERSDPMWGPSEMESRWSAHITVEAPTRRLGVGDDAPQFSYMDVEGQWQPFQELIAQSPVLLLFGGSADDWVAMEHARHMFADMGVTPVVVLEGRVGSAGTLARRLGISGPLVTDPRRAIGDLYNSLDPRSRGHAPSYFVVDQARTIRSYGHGPLPSPVLLLGECARSLGRPLPDSAWSMLGE